MRRVLALLASASLVLAPGCGKSYERRADATLRRERYKLRLDQNLKPATAGKFQELGIFFGSPSRWSGRRHRA